MKLVTRKSRIECDDAIYDIVRVLKESNTDMKDVGSCLMDLRVIANHVGVNVNIVALYEIVKAERGAKQND